MSNIIRLNNNRVIIKSPKQTNTQELEKLDKSLIILIYQLVLHKQMDISKITRVMISKEEPVQKQVDFLLRSGIIIKKGINYEINAYMQNTITTVLKNMDIL